MAVHACVKGFGGEAFLTCFSGGSRLKNSGLSLPETLNDKRIKRNGTYSQIHEHTQSCLPSMNLFPNGTFLGPVITLETIIQFYLQTSYSVLILFFFCSSILLPRCSTLIRG